MPCICVSMTHPIDEEGPCAANAAMSPTRVIFVHAVRKDMVGHIPVESLSIKTQDCSVLHQVIIIKFVLVFEQVVVHLPKLALSGRSLGSLGGMSRMWVDTGDWKVAKGKPQPGAHLPLDLFDDGMGSSAIGALVISIFHECHACSRWALHMVTIAHRHGKLWHL